jgi:hypothetical protein
MLPKKHASESEKRKKKRETEDLIQSERMKKIFLCIVFIILETSLC